MNGSFYRVGIVGYGIIAEKGHTPALLQNRSLSVRGIADVTPSRLIVARSHFPDCNIYTSLRDMLACEELDIIIVCTPPTNHFKSIIRGLKAGCHVICEKPVVLRTGEYEMVVETIKSVRKQVFPCHNYKFREPLLAAKKFLASGRIGRAKQIQMSIIRPRHAKGCRDWRPNWRTKKKISGGGIIIDHGVHSIYLSMFLTNEHPISHESFILASRDSRGFDTEDVAILSLRFPNSASHVFLSWRGEKRVSKYQIDGEDGNISIDGEWLSVQSGNGPVLNRLAMDKSSCNGRHHVLSYMRLYRDCIRRIESRISPCDLLMEAKVATSIIQEIYERKHQ